RAPARAAGARAQAQPRRDVERLAGADRARARDRDGDGSRHARDSDLGVPQSRLTPLWTTPRERRPGGTVDAVDTHAGLLRRADGLALRRGTAIDPAFRTRAARRVRRGVYCTDAAMAPSYEESVVAALL